MAPPRQRPGLLPSERSSGITLQCRPWPRGNKQAVATCSPSPTEPTNLLMRIVGVGCGPDCNSTVNYVKIMERKGWMCARASHVTYDAAWGLVRGRLPRLLSTSHTELCAREPLTLLGAFASGFMGAALFFLPTSGGESSSSSSSSSSSADEEEVSSSDVTSGAPFQRGPLLAVFSGTS